MADQTGPAGGLDEVARILALGVLRLRAREVPKSSRISGLRENFLDFVARPSLSEGEPRSPGEAP